MGIGFNNLNFGQLNYIIKKDFKKDGQGVNPETDNSENLVPNNNNSNNEAKRDFKLGTGANYVAAMVQAGIRNNNTGMEQNISNEEHLEKVLDEFFKMYEESLGPELAGQLCGELESLAREFLASYEGTNFKADLVNYLNYKMKETQYDEFDESKWSFDSTISNFGGYVSSEELKTAKAAACALVTDICNGGIINVLEAHSLNYEINNAKTLSEIIDIVNSVMENISKTSLLEKYEKMSEEAKEAENDAATQAKQEADEQLAKEEENARGVFNLLYKDNGGTLNVTAPNNYTLMSNAKIDSNNYDKLINGDFKENLMEQIKSQCTELGIPYDMVEVLFEKAYDFANDKTLIWVNSHKLPIDKLTTKEVIDYFIFRFNAKLFVLIGAMNESDKDIDLQDIDFTQWGTEITTDEKWNKKVEELKGILLTKAELVMGDNFDQEIFNAVFDAVIDSVGSYSYGADAMKLNVIAIRFQQEYEKRTGA